MGGDFVGQGLPDPDDLPDSPAAEDGTPPDDDAADVDQDPDSQAADETDDDADAADADDGDEPGDDDGTGDEGASPTFDKLLAKYKGDKEAFARAYIEQANSMSDLTADVREIKEFIQGQQQQQDDVPTISPEEMKQRIAESPDVSEVSEELESVKDDLKREQDNYRNLAIEVGKAEKAVARLEGKLESAYEDNKPSISAELASAQSKLERLMDKWKDSDRSINTLSAKMRRDIRRMEKAEKQARSEIENTIKQQRQEATSAQEVRTEFAQAMIAEAKERGVTPKDPQFQVLFDSVQARLWAYTQTLPEDADPINIPMAVKLLTKQYFDAGFGGKSFQTASGDKRKATTGKGTPSREGDSGRTPKKGRPMTAADWDKRAQRMLGG